MKYLKQKLMAAVAMLAVSAVMLTSASYAWFTISVTPEVKTIKTTVTANENFEIALGTTGITAAEEPKATTYDETTRTSGTWEQTQIDQTWGATILSLSSGLSGLGPATLNDNVVQTVEYGVDGRPAGYVDATPVADMADGKQALKDANGNVVGWKILLWLRSNVPGSVTADVTGITLEKTEGELQPTNAGNKVKVAFDWKADGLEVSNPTYENGECRSIPIGQITSGENGNVDKAIPVYVYIYLEGENVTNADVEDDFVVQIGNIKFYNSGVAEDTSEVYNKTVASTGGTGTGSN